MPPPIFYLETSVWGSLAPRQPRDRKQAVQRLLRLLDGVRGICRISRVVVAEVVAADPAYSTPIIEQLALVKPDVLPITGEVEALARAYIESGVLPRRRETDAVHVAVATCSRRAMNSNIDDFLDEIDQWKFRVQEQLKELTPKQRVTFWTSIGQRARDMGLHVIEPERPAQRPAKRGLQRTRKPSVSHAVGPSPRT